MTNPDLREYIYENEIIPTWKAHNKNAIQTIILDNVRIIIIINLNGLNRFTYFSKLQLW